MELGVDLDLGAVLLGLVEFIELDLRGLEWELDRQGWRRRGESVGLRVL